MNKTSHWFAIAACVLFLAAVVPFDTTSNSNAAPAGRLQCPVGRCSVGGFNFGDDWTFNKCPPKGPWKKHTGADLRAAAGTTVVAAEAGTVRLVYSAREADGRVRFSSSTEVVTLIL